MKIKTSELAGPALDWAAAQCQEGLVVEIYRGRIWLQWFQTYGYLSPTGSDSTEYSPSTDWSQGGPIVERERITIVAQPDGTWTAQGKNHRPFFHNPTPLVAAMRCYVASKLGDEVDIQEELL